MNIHTNGLGLRSGKDAEDVDVAASYAMAYGQWTTVPDDFDKLLGNTIDQILGFENAGSRSLILVSGVYPTSGAYGGSDPTFPKCSSKPREAVASCAIADKSRQELIDWVLDSL